MKTDCRFDEPPGRMAGKRCLITGGSAGIGKVAARRLRAMGADVIIAGRDPRRGAAAVAEIEQCAGDGRIRFMAADLSDLRQIADLADQVSQAWPSLDVLVNNAGGLFGRRGLTEQGFERTFALNHLGYFALTQALLPMLERAAPARIISVSSGAHRWGSLDFDDLQNARNYQTLRAYSRSKLCNVLFTRALARRLDPGKIAVSVLHPGFVATDIGVRHRFLPQWVWRLSCRFALPPERGADPIVMLASAPDPESRHGRYFDRCEATEPSTAARDDAVAERLWEASLAMVSRGEPLTIG